MLRGTKPLAITLAVSKSKSYGEVFEGKTIQDKARLNEVKDWDTFLPLWIGVVVDNKQQPTFNSTETLPFIWNEKGVQYSSDCLAFDKNMWVAQQIGNHWNQAIQMEMSPDTAISTHIKPGMVLIGHLTDESGLNEDLSRPAEEELLPPSIRTNTLVPLKNALNALYWSYEGEAANDPERTFYAKYRAAQYGKKSEPFLNKAWVDSREIEAGNSYGDHLKRVYESGPAEELGTQSYEAFAATASYIGMGLSTTASVSKAEVTQKAEQCLGDLKMVHGLQDPKIRAMKKKVRKLKDILAHASMGSTLQDPVWMREKRFQEFYVSTDRIKLN